MWHRCSSCSPVIREGRRGRHDRCEVIKNSCHMGAVFQMKDSRSARIKFMNEYPGKLLMQEPLLPVNKLSKNQAGEEASLRGKVEAVCCHWKFTLVWL